MPSEAYIASIERHVADDIATSGCLSLLAKADNGELDVYAAEGFIRSVILKSFELAAKRLSVPRVGTMGFDEAMNLVTNSFAVTRADWDIDRHLMVGGDRFDPESRYDFHLGGYYIHDECGRDWKLYCPTDEDRAAADWMKYERVPELWIDLDD